ncbi:MAG: hypothetical protein ABIV06_00580 [Thermoanaerobaculia bacterium]
MNRFARIMQFLGWTGSALLAAVWAQGFRVQDGVPELARHSTLALVAALLCVLPRFWTIAYLYLAARGRARIHDKQGSGDAAGRKAARVRRQALAASALALVGLSGSFALAGALLLRHTSPISHAAAGALAVALQVVALVLERRALRVDSEEMRDLLPAPGNPVPNAS